MTIEEQFAEIVRRVVREELAGLTRLDDDDLLTADEVAAMLKYPDRHSVYKLRREKKLIATLLGDKTLRFRRGEVRRFIGDSTG